MDRTVVGFLAFADAAYVRICGTFNVSARRKSPFRSLVRVDLARTETALSLLRDRTIAMRGKVIAAMKRTGAEGDFRSNLHRGGSAQFTKLSPEVRATAPRAAKSMGLNVCGVDMLRANHGPVVMEVNSSPGLEGVEKATGLDVAGKIIEYIEKNAKPGATKTKGKG
nr:hypothetical protein [Aestuariivita sp.]